MIIVIGLEAAKKRHERQCVCGPDPPDLGRVGGGAGVGCDGLWISLIGESILIWI